MKKTKALVLYAGLGGTRAKWPDNVDVTAVEINETIAAVYSHNFPKDKLIIGDAHEFLLSNFDKYDIITGSPPCWSHSRARFARRNTTTPIYPDLKLYEEIIFLQKYFTGRWFIENVKPYYDPLIAPTKICGRHYIWSNFPIGNYDFKDLDITNGTRRQWEQELGISIEGFKLNERRDKVLRNCLHPNTGRYLLDCALETHKKANTKQLDLYDLIDNL